MQSRRVKRYQPFHDTGVIPVSFFRSQGPNADGQCVVIPSYKRMFICGGGEGGGAAPVAASARDDNDAAAAVAGF